MPAPRYITSENQLGAPGVYVIELAPASPIRGQRNRVIAFAGQCVRGPLLKAVKCTTYKRFVDVFGERDKNSNGGTVIGHVWRALQAKRWGVIYVARAAAAAAVIASYTARTAAGGGGANVLRIDAANPGTWANDVQWKVSNPSNGDANYFKLTIALYGRTFIFDNITTASINGTSTDNTNQVIGSDDATLIRLTKLADGRPVNSTANTDGADANGFIKLGAVNAGYTSVAGTDGAIADTDYTAAGGPMEIISSTRGVHACCVVGRSNATIKTKIQTLAGTVSQRVWFATGDSAAVTVAAAVTERQAFTGALGRLSYWFNWEYIQDPVTLEQIQVEPFLMPMSIISQTDPDVHPGDYDNVALTTGSRGVTVELADGDRDTLDAASVSYIWHDIDPSGNDVIIPGNALTCDLNKNNIDLDGRYMKDFLLDAIAQRMRGDQLKGNTPRNRAARKAAVTGFLTTQAKNDRYVLRDEQGNPQFTYTNDSSVNTTTDQAVGLQRDKLVATLIPKNKQIELLATVGVNAIITEL